MANIFINGLNAKVGGGRSILNNLLAVLKENNFNDKKFFVLTPVASEYEKYENDFINIVDISNKYKNNLIIIYTYKFIIPRLIKKLNIDLIFNLADIPIPIENAKQVFLFDWSYAVYPESIVWEMMDIKSYFIRKLKLYYFKKYLNFITQIIAQTNTMKVKLEKLYGVNNVKVVPNAVSLGNLSQVKYIDFNLPTGIKLLYLTHYYPHKNLEVLLPLAIKIKKEKLNFKIIITISENQHKKAKLFLNKVNKYNLNYVIINVGPVEMQHVPSLYKQCDGLIMPTLLESYGLPYFEAMQNELPIFTSNLDFAKDVCQDAAFYFNPCSDREILEVLKKSFNNQQLRTEKIIKGKRIVNNLDTWKDTLNKYLYLIDKELKDEN